jgi:hypothetical protein
MNRKLLLLAVACFVGLAVVQNAILLPLSKAFASPDGRWSPAYAGGTLVVMLLLVLVVALVIARWYGLTGARLLWTALIAAVLSLGLCVAALVLIINVPWPQDMLMSLVSPLGGLVTNVVIAAEIVLVSWLVVLRSQRPLAAEHVEQALPADGASSGQ